MIYYKVKVNSPYSPFLLALYWKTVYRIFHGIILLILRFDLLHLHADIKPLLPSLLCQVLPQDRLVTLVPLLLALRVKQVTLGALRVPYYVLVSLFDLLLFNFFNLALGLLFELVMQRYEQVSLPNVELCLKSIGLADGREERLVLGGKLT